MTAKQVIVGQSHDIDIRVRYSEVDQMGFLHHANYLTFFEMGRTELFRTVGGNYAELESRGFFLVIVSIECQYKQSAKYDDVLTVTTRLARATPAKLVHEYEVHREGQLMATARSVIACVDRDGQIQRIDNHLLYGSREGKSV